MAKDFVKYKFEKFAPHFKMDMKKADQIIKYGKTFERKNEQTVLFLGGNLIGVHEFIWRPEVEGADLMEEIIGIRDIASLTDEVHSLEAINPQFSISSNIVNHAHLWVAHQAFISNLPSNKKQEVIFTMLNMLQYKFLSSIHTRWFKFKSNEQIALACYESLNDKWGLKKYGTWKALIQHRSESIIARDSRWRPVIEKMQDDEELVLMLNDTQGRIKDVLKKLMGRYKELREQDAKIHASTKFVTVDGETLIKEQSDKYITIRNRIVDMAIDKRDFIDDDLMEAIVKTLSTVNKKALEKVLEYVLETFPEPKRKEEYTKLFDDIVVYTIELSIQENIKLDKLVHIMFKLRSMFRSSRVVDPNLLSIRNRCGTIVEKALKTRSVNTVSSIRIGLILYIALRALTS